MIGDIPIWRLVIHDWSKFTPVEFINYSRYKYGVKSVDGWAKAWFHHLHHNPHHAAHWILSWSGDPDYYRGLGESVAPFITVLSMPETYVREMVVDMMVTSKEVSGSYDISMWLNENGPNQQWHSDTITRLNSVMHEVGYSFDDNHPLSYVRK